MPSYWLSSFHTLHIYLQQKPILYIYTCNNNAILYIYTYNRNPYYTYIPTTITYTYNNNIYLQQ